MFGRIRYALAVIGAPIDEQPPDERISGELNRYRSTVAKDWFGEEPVKERRNLGVVAIECILAAVITVYLISPVFRHLLALTTPKSQALVVSFVTMGAYFFLEKLKHRFNLDGRLKALDPYIGRRLRHVRSILKGRQPVG